MNKTRKISEVIRDAALYRLAASHGRWHEQFELCVHSCEAVSAEYGLHACEAREFVRRALPPSCRELGAFANRPFWTFEQRQSTRFMWLLFCSYLAKDEGL